MKAYPSLAGFTPETVDYAYVSRYRLPQGCPPLICPSAKGHLRISHMLLRQRLRRIRASKRIARSNSQRRQREKRGSGRSARTAMAGIRRAAILTFCYDGHARRRHCRRPAAERRSRQSTQSAGAIIRGLRYSGVMTIGNCADVGVELICSNFILQTPRRAWSLACIWKAFPDGRRMIRHAARKAQWQSPSLSSRAGGAEFGRAAAMSHTGTLAGDERLWDAVCATNRRHVLALTPWTISSTSSSRLQCLEPRTGGRRPNARNTARQRRWDKCSGRGHLSRGKASDVMRRSRDSTIEASCTGIGTCDTGAALTANPVDLPRNRSWSPERRPRHSRRYSTHMVFEDACDPHAVVLHINLSVVMSLAGGADEALMHLLDAAVRVKEDHLGKAHFLLVLRSDGNLAFEATRIRYRARALVCGIPTYDEIPAAANAVAAIAQHERYLAKNTYPGII